MDYTYVRRRAAADRAGRRTAPPVSGSPAFALPNSALPGAGEGGMGRDALRQAMREKMAARFGPDYRNRNAEAEADRIGGRFSAASGVEDLKERMGAALGADFSPVRFHTGSEASAMAAASHARAFTSGRDIFLGGAFDAATAAHELVHTVQQGAVEAASPVTSAPMGAVQYKKKDDEPEDEEAGWFYRNFTGPHRKALDQLNNHTRDFNDMSLSDRAAWAVQNPIAYIRGSGSSRKETEERNAEKRREDEMAAAIAHRREKERNRAAGAAGSAAPAVPDNVATRAMAPALSALGVDMSAGASGGSAAQKAPPAVEGTAAAPGWFDMAKTATGDWGTGTGVSALALPNEYHKYKQARANIKMGKPDEGLKNWNDRYAKAAGVVSLVSNASNVVNRFQNAVTEGKEGNYGGLVEEELNGIADSFSTIGDAAGLGGYDPASAGFSFLGNAMRFGTGLGSAIGNAGSSIALNSRSNRLKEETADLASKEPEELTEKEQYQLMRQRAAAQGAEAANIRGESALTSTLSSGVRAIGDMCVIGAPEGPGQVANAVTGAIAAGIDGLGNLKVNSDKADLYRKTVSEDTNLDEGTQYVQQHGWEALEGFDSGKRLPKTKAERVHLKSMGFPSGDMQEAFNAITMQRANALTERANAGGEEETGIMRNMLLTRMKNPKTGKEEYNPNAVAKKLGYEDLPPENPFAEGAEREKKRQEEDRRRTEQERERLKQPSAAWDEYRRGTGRLWF